MDIATLTVYMYLFGTIVVVALMYGYIMHLYRSEKKGEADYEKFGKLALDDEIDSKPLVARDPKVKNEKRRSE